jgi:hypothetical protein
MINGNMRTPKIYALNNLIDWLNFNLVTPRRPFPRHNRGDATPVREAGASPPPPSLLPP